ncbi:MAG: exosortase system-associated protein, TIGR04073 family [Gammaproteobacteria bacterium]
MNKLKKLTLTSSLALMLITGGVQADTAAQKFGRGLAGMTCGFLELPGNLVRETNTRGPAGIPLGFAKGLGMMVTRELVGVYEFVSAPFPVPAGFRPILQPEYPWGYFH